MTVVDTSVLVEVLRRRSPWLERVRALAEEGQLATTAVNVAELAAGAQGRRRRQAIAALLAVTHVLPVDEPAAWAAAAVRRSLERDGARIGHADELIAGVCLAAGAPLLTRDEHFARLAGALTLAS